MNRVLIAYFSQGGHVQQLAEAAAQGAAGIRDSEVVTRRVPQLPAAEQAMGPAAGSEPEVRPEDLVDYNAVIFGTPTRFGNMCAQMRQFLDQAGPVWAAGKLVGKVGSVFTSTNTQHGGQETTITSFHSTLLHLGMVVVGVPYSCQQLLEMGEISGGSPYGASTMAGNDGSRMPTENERAIARFQGRHVTEIARRLTA